MAHGDGAVLSTGGHSTVILAVGTQPGQGPAPRAAHLQPFRLPGATQLHLSLLTGPKHGANSLDLPLQPPVCFGGCFIAELLSAVPSP